MHLLDKKGTNCVFASSLSRLHQGKATHHLLIHSFLLKQSRGRLTVGGEKRLAGWRDRNKQWFLTRTPPRFVLFFICILTEMHIFSYTIADTTWPVKIHTSAGRITCYSNIHGSFYNSQALCFDFSTHKWRSQDCKSTSSVVFRMASQLPDNNVINKLEWALLKLPQFLTMRFIKCIHFQEIFKIKLAAKMPFKNYYAVVCTEELAFFFALCLALLVWPVMYFILPFTILGCVIFYLFIF